MPEEGGHRAERPGRMPEDGIRDEMKPVPPLALQVSSSDVEHSKLKSLQAVTARAWQAFLATQ